MDGATKLPVIAPFSRFLAVGECMVEFAPHGGQHDVFHQGFAGDTFNSCWYMRRLAPDLETVGFVTAVGTDAVSERMLEAMRAGGIDTGHVHRDHDRTVGAYLITLDNGERSFTIGAASLRHAPAGATGRMSQPSPTARHCCTFRAYRWQSSMMTAGTRLSA